ncbi:MAG: hypothetical protein ACXABY_30445 [Candidatus Thorarchaeota archaeon]|jgi:hypothetical protein
MQEMRLLLNFIIKAKRDLKEIYYTNRDENLKADAKELVAAIIAVQRTLEQILALKRRSRTAKKVLGDRKAEMSVRRWSAGLPRRVRDYVQKEKKLEQHHLHRYQVILLQYLDNMGKELVAWAEDIDMLREIPRIPKE